MSKNYDSLCTSPQDPISKPPAGPNFSTGGGQFGGEAGVFPGGTSSGVISPKIFDKAMPNPPKDETRGVKS